MYPAGAHDAERLAARSIRGGSDRARVVIAACACGAVRCRGGLESRVAFGADSSSPSPSPPLDSARGSESRCRRRATRIEPERLEIDRAHRGRPAAIVDQISAADRRALLADARSRVASNSVRARRRPSRRCCGHRRRAPAPPDPRFGRTVAPLAAAAAGVATGAGASTASSGSDTRADHHAVAASPSRSGLSSMPGACVAPPDLLVDLDHARGRDHAVVDRERDRRADRHRRRQLEISGGRPHLGQLHPPSQREPAIREIHEALAHRRPSYRAHLRACRSLLIAGSASLAGRVSAERDDIGARTQALVVHGNEFGFDPFGLSRQEPRARR